MGGAVAVIGECAASLSALQEAPASGQVLASIRFTARLRPSAALTQLHLDDYWRLPCQEVADSAAWDLSITCTDRSGVGGTGVRPAQLADSASCTFHGVGVWGRNTRAHGRPCATWCCWSIRVIDLHVWC
jgi:hypothetical protein